MDLVKLHSHNQMYHLYTLSVVILPFEPGTRINWNNESQLKTVSPLELFKL